MKLRAEFESLGGYDCMTDAFVIYDGAQRVAIIDLRDFDANVTGAGADAHAIRSAGEIRALRYALIISTLESPMLTTQSQVRAAFWRDLDLMGAPQDKPKSQNDYPADIRAAWVDYVDLLARRGEISAKLAQEVTL